MHASEQPARPHSSEREEGREDRAERERASEGQNKVEQE